MQPLHVIAARQTGLGPRHNIQSRVDQVCISLLRKGIMAYHTPGVFKMAGGENEAIMKNLPFTRRRRRQFNFKEARDRSARIRDHMSI